MEPVLEATVVAAGFEGFERVWKKNVFEGASRPRQEVEEWGTCGVNIAAHKPE